MTVLARNGSGVAATNSSTKRSLQEEVDGLRVDEAQQLVWQARPAARGHRPAEQVQLLHAALVARHLEE
jgi:hypothetical protein